jgi:alanine-synthesizing transaminase
MYLFFKLDETIYPIADDETFVLNLLKKQHLLLVQGSAFHCPDQQHFRMVFLPDKDLLAEAINRLSKFLAEYRQN